MQDNGQHPLNFKAKTRTSKKPYIFDFHAARLCTHPVLREVVQGSHKYRCGMCNYDFWLPSATMWPAHWGPIMAALEMIKFVRDFGLEALEQVYKTPIGQYDGSEHKPVLPEGKSLLEVLQEMDDIDIRELAGGELFTALTAGKGEPDGGDAGEDESPGGG